ncbi:MAG: hypothetical protein QOJ76_3247 [Acidobacteriota bacterium]|jgi:hypothetical protein|nr:hypothetical protein [Acidobacteriota bacterium]
MQKRARKIAMSFVGAVVVACCLALNASAQTGGQPKPVRFEKGRTTAILKGTADNAHGFTYILAAKKGQTMTVHVTARGGAAIFSVTAPGGPIDDALEVKDWTGELPDTGNYLIAVWNRKKRGAAIPYTLELTIR